jgi:hypothetical protein
MTAQKVQTSTEFQLNFQVVGKIITIDLLFCFMMQQA